MPDAREQAEAVARFMGWEKRHPWPWVSPLGNFYESCPSYTSLDAMREVEDELERKKLMGRYVEALWHGHAPGICYREEYIAFGLRATAAQRLAAAARVIEEVERAG